GVGAEPEGDRAPGREAAARETPTASSQGVCGEWNRSARQSRYAPPPLGGEGWGGGWFVRQRGRRKLRPPPPTPPHKGEGSAPSVRRCSASNTNKYVPEVNPMARQFVLEV